MSEVAENISEQNSAQSKEEAAAQSTETVEEVTTNNVEAATEAVPEAVEVVSAANQLSKPATEEESSISPKVENKKTPAKRTPSKRMSFIERAQKESEELVKNMGGSLEIEGGRRTRSSTRGTPTRSVAVSTPPPAKKARTSPASGASTPTRRGRGRKIDTTLDDAEEEEITPTPSKKKTPTKGKKAAAAAKEDDEKMTENPEETKDDEKKTDNDEKPEDEEKVLASEEIKADEAKNTPEKVTENSEEDKTDGVLEPVIEESESQEGAESTTTTEANVTNKPESSSDSHEEKVPDVIESIKNDSPMDTEEQKPVENVTEQKETTVIVVEPEETKEPTPEPMEVDSSSKSNDTDGVEKMEDDVAEVINKEVITVEKITGTISELNNIDKIEEKQISVDTKVVANNSLEVKSVAEPIATEGVANANENNTQQTTPAANDSNKTENDLCEPKIATSPPISAANDNSTVTTPQTCN